MARSALSSTKKMKGLDKTANKTKNKKQRRSNGEGTIYQMKDGRFGAAVDLGKDQDGKRNRVVVTGKTEKIVKAKMQLLLKEKGLLLEVDICIKEALTIEVDYDTDGNKLGRKVVLGPTKMGTGDRVISKSDDMVNILREWKRAAPSITRTKLGQEDFVFGNSRNARWSYSGFRSSVNMQLSSNGALLTSLGLHRIRHTVATIMAEDGASLF